MKADWSVCPCVYCPEEMPFVSKENGTRSRLRISFILKTRQVAAFRNLNNKQVVALVHRWVWQHHALHIITLDGTELLPHRWYHTDKAYQNVYGPFDSKSEAANACARFLGIWT